MSRRVLSQLSALSLFALAIAFGNGCVISHTACLSAPEVIHTDLPRITLTELTSPSVGRNVTSTSHEDRITATITPLPGSAQMEIRLEAAPGVTWWKGVEIRQAVGAGTPISCFRAVPGERLFMAETQDDRNVATIVLANALAPRSTLVFWKGKTLQVHTQMYQLSGNLGSLQGQRLTLRWEVD